MDRSHMNNGSSGDDRSSRRPKKGAFCFSCGRNGHDDADCPQAAASPASDVSTPSVSSSQASFTADSSRSIAESPRSAPSRRSGPERSGSENSGSTEGASSITYSNESSGKKSKGGKAASHDALERLYKTGVESRNPVGENFLRYQVDSVKVSDDSFRNLGTETFDDFDLHEDILAVVKKKYKTPLPIQQYSMRIINSGRNLKASGRTGCGKTAAYLLPVINKILRNDVRTEKKLPQYPKALIILPTHELAQQIYDEATKFAARTDVKINLFHGSTVMRTEIDRLRMGTNIVIGTLGRTVDHLHRKNINLEELRFLIFDEADRIMEDDFAESIGELMSHINACGSPPQTLMFSATFEERIMSKIDTLFADHVSLQVGVLGTVNEDIQQSVMLVHECDKRETLLEILREEQPRNVKTLVFVRSRERAEQLSQFLFVNEVLVAVLHGDRDQLDRTKAVKDFNDGTRNVMVATLLANRGLDVNLVNHVINYDLPGAIEEYVNCLGRTGRVGNSGRATSFFDPDHRDDKAISSSLRSRLQDAGMEDIPDFLRVV